MIWEPTKTLISRAKYGSFTGKTCRKWSRSSLKHSSLQNPNRWEKYYCVRRLVLFWSLFSMTHSLCLFLPERQSEHEKHTKGEIKRKEFCSCLGKNKNTQWFAVQMSFWQTMGFQCSSRECKNQTRKREEPASLQGVFEADNEIHRGCEQLAGHDPRNQQNVQRNIGPEHQRVQEDSLETKFWTDSDEAFAITLLVNNLEGWREKHRDPLHCTAKTRFTKTNPSNGKKRATHTWTNEGVQYYNDTL